VRAARHEAVACAQAASASGAGSPPQLLGRAPHQVRAVLGHAAPAHAERERTAALDQTQLVSERDRLEHRADIVVAGRVTGADAQRQVDLGVRTQRKGARHG